MSSSPVAKVVREFIRVPLYTDGKYAGMPRYEDVLHQAKHWSRTSLRVEVQMWNPSGHVCVTNLGRRRVILQADIPKDAHKLALLHVRVDQQGSGTRLIHDDLSHVLNLRHVTAESVYALKEFCTGIGGLGVGASYADFHVHACNEKQEAYCHLLSHMWQHAVIPGNMAFLDVIAQMHEASPDSTSVGAGFNCQSFSNAGDRRGGQDERAMTLPWTLWASYMLNAPLIVLECVSEAPTFPWVRACIQQFTDTTCFAKSEIVLELASLWPSHRKRWWCVLSDGMFGKIPLAPLPCFSRTPVVSDVFEDFRLLPDELEHQLTLQKYELTQLDKFGTNLDKLCADCHGTMPTALHSWANQLAACKCGCRSQGLSHERLGKRGFFGTLIRYQKDGITKYRHPAPQELAVLVGLPLALPKSDARLLVSSVGQIASPIQSCWIFAHIRRHMEQVGFVTKEPQLVGTGLLELIQDTFKVRDVFIQSREHHTLAMQAFEEQMYITLAPLSTKALTRSQEAQDDPVAVENDPPEEAVVSKTEEDDNSSDITDAQLLEAVNRIEGTSHPAVVSVPDIPGAVPGFGPSSMHVSSGISPQTPALISMPGPMQTEEHVAAVSSPTSLAFPPDLGVSPPADAPPVSSANAAGGSMVGDEGDLPTEEYPDTPEVASDEEPQVHASMDPGTNQQTFAQQLYQVAMQPRTAITPTCFPGTVITPEDLVAKKTVVFNTITGVIDAYHIADNVQVGTLRQREAELMDVHVNCISIRNAVGRIIQDSDLVANTECVVILPWDHPEAVPNAQHEHWLTPMPRGQSLLLQGGGVADDEMRYFLSALESQGLAKVVHPLLLTYFEDSWNRCSEWLQMMFQEVQKPVVSMILVTNHWIPFVVLPSAPNVLTTTAEGELLLQGLAPQVQSSVQSDVPSAFPHDCGFQSFTWVAQLVGSNPVSNIMGYDEAAS